MYRHIRVSAEDIELSEEERRLLAACSGFGAICSFIGYVRDLEGGDRLHALELEHYPGMTERSLGQLIDEAQSRWELAGVTLIHRIGLLKPGERIVLVMAVSAHRSEAFAACEFLMDYLKTRAPFWKKEHYQNRADWVEERKTDTDRAARWS